MWSNWRSIEEAKQTERGFCGIYEIGLVGCDGKPLQVERFKCVDEEGVIYIGKAGPSRTLATRIHEFEKIANHSGSVSYLCWSKS